MRNDTLMDIKCCFSCHCFYFLVHQCKFSGKLRRRQQWKATKVLLNVKNRPCWPWYVHMVCSGKFHFQELRTKLPTYYAFMLRHEGGQKVMQFVCLWFLYPPFFKLFSCLILMKNLGFFFLQGVSWNLGTFGEILNQSSQKDL